MKRIYLDHAASTPIDPRVMRAMDPFFTKHYGNPSSFHSMGKTASDSIDAARTKIANIIEARQEEIVFTSGGTEANNLAILGIARANEKFGKHIITSAIEHESVMEATKKLDREGFEITYLPVDKFGLVSADELMSAIRPDTILISIMFANNEIGSIQPIAEIGKLLTRTLNQQSKIQNQKFPIFHTDACQAAGALEISVAKTHVDSMTINGSKIYGPKGAGALFIKRGVKIQPTQFGGDQQKGIRPGTENVPAIIGLARALELAQKEKRNESARLAILRDMLIGGILEKVPKCRLNGHPTQRLPNNVNISVMDIEGEALTIYLDAKGIYCSTGSACASATLDPSHVILALGVPPEVAHGSIRFSLGKSTTKKDIKRVIKEIAPIIEMLRSISPVRVDEKYFK